MEMERLIGLKKQQVNEKYWKETNKLRQRIIKEKTHLKEGELFCDKCEGTGRHKFKENYLLRCPKCRGKGVVDWISNVVGVKVKTIDDYKNDFVAFASEMLSQKIDNEIMEAYLNTMEQNIK